jgi:hypothetical protein
LKERLQREEAIHDPSPFQRFKSTIRTPILLLGLLLPKKDQVTGKRRTRLFFISAAFFCGSVVAAYAAQALLVYSTTRFKFDATKVCPLQLTVLNPRLTKNHIQNGILLTTLTITQILWLLILAPLLLHFLDRLYYRSPPPRSLISGDPEATETDSDSISSSEDVVNHVSEAEKKASAVGRRDVHIAIFSYTLESLFQLFVGLARTGPQLIAGIFTPAYKSHRSLNNIQRRLCGD